MDMKYMVLWINSESKKLCTARYADRKEAMGFSELIRKSSDVCNEVLVTVRGDNGYFLPLD